MSSIAANDDTERSAVSSPLTLRVLSAAVLLPVVLVLLWAGGWAFAGLVLLAAALMGYEWHRLTVGRFDAAAASATVALMAGAAALMVFPTWTGPAVLGLAGLGLLAAAPRLAGELRWRLLALLWLGVPVQAVLWLRLQPEIGLWLVGWLLVTVWAADTGAYFAGRAIGGPKLAPRISPGKTWAGFVGGVLGAALAGGLVAAAAGAAPTIAALASLAVAAVSQVGDLAESALKRHFGVKDSGRLIPGHGGILDRVDALLFAAPAAALLYGLSGGRLPLW